MVGNKVNLRGLWHAIFLCKFAQCCDIHPKMHIFIFILIFLPFSGCHYDNHLRSKVNAFFYTDSKDEEGFIREYNDIYPYADLEVQISDDKGQYYNEIEAMSQADKLPDVFSIWSSRKYRSLLNSKKLADLHKLGKIDTYSASIDTSTRDSLLKMLPVRYNYGNTMLINMDLLQTINQSLDIDMISTYEDFLNLAQITKDHGLEFLVIGDSNAFSFGDLFFSAVVGWLDRSWLKRYQNGEVNLSSSKPVISSIRSFYSRFSDIFSDPSMAKLSRSAAEGMFLNGEVLLIIGSTDQLLPLLRKSPMRVDWMAFPQLSRQSHIFTETRIGKLFRPLIRQPYDDYDTAVTQGRKGAVLDDVLGVSVTSRVFGYNSIRYNEVASVLDYYIGSYANDQRILKWDIPSLASHFTVSDGQNIVMDKTIGFLNSINYVYFRPSVYLSEEFNQELDRGTWNLLQDQESLEPFIKDLLHLEDIENNKLRKLKWPQILKFLASFYK